MGLGFAYGFPFDASILSRSLYILNDNPGIKSDDLARALGIGWKKAIAASASLMYMGLRCPDKTELTSLGVCVLKHDPGLKQAKTQLALHYQLCSNEQATFWNWACNRLSEASSAFSRSDLVSWYAVDHQKTRNLKNVLGDAKIFVRAYEKGGLLEKTGYLRSIEPGMYSTANCQVPPLTLAYAVYAYAGALCGRLTLPVQSLLASRGSPGRIFLLQEEELRSILRKLESEGIVDVYRNAELDNVALTFQGSPLDLLEMCYDSEDE